jgi:hypothetical protein
VLTQNQQHPGWGHGTDPLGNPVDYPPFLKAQAIDVTVVAGMTLVSITANTTVVNPGGLVNLTVTEANTGNAGLTNPYVTVNPGGYLLNKASIYYVSGDIDNDGVLDGSNTVAETWTWIITNVVVKANTTIIDIGHGTDPLGNEITWPPMKASAGQSASLSISPIPRPI